MFYSWNIKCKLPGRFEGKTMIVTGANSGIGLETCAELARRGATVIMACRNILKAQKAKEIILDRYNDGNPACLSANVANKSIIQYLTPVKEEQLIVMELDLENHDSIRAFASRANSNFQKIDMLINNAGVYFQNTWTTKRGYECHVDINYLGPFLLTELLIEKLISSQARIINVASMAHKRSPYIDTERLDLLDDRKNQFAKAYGYSKLLNSLHAMNLTRKYGNKGITAVSLHPGVISTNLGQNTTGFLKAILPFGRPFIKNCWDGAQTTMYCALIDHPKPGAYYSDCGEATLQYQADLDDVKLDAIWEWSLQRVGLMSKVDKSNT